MLFALRKGVFLQTKGLAADAWLKFLKFVGQLVVGEERGRLLLGRFSARICARRAASSFLGHEWRERPDEAMFFIHILVALWMKIFY